MLCRGESIPTANVLVSANWVPVRTKIGRGRVSACGRVVVTVGVRGFRLPECESEVLRRVQYRVVSQYVTSDTLVSVGTNIYKTFWSVRSSSEQFGTRIELDTHQTKEGCIVARMVNRVWKDTRQLMESLDFGCRQGNNIDQYD